MAMSSFLATSKRNSKKNKQIAKYIKYLKKFALIFWFSSNFLHGEIFYGSLTQAEYLPQLPSPHCHQSASPGIGRRPNVFIQEDEYGMVWYYDAMHRGIEYDVQTLPQMVSCERPLEFECVWFIGEHCLTETILVKKCSLSRALVHIYISISHSLRLTVSSQVPFANIHLLVGMRQCT